MSCLLFFCFSLCLMSPCILMYTFTNIFYNACVHICINVPHLQWYILYMIFACIIIVCTYLCIIKMKCRKITCVPIHSCALGRCLISSRKFCIRHLFSNIHNSLPEIAEKLYCKELLKKSSTILFGQKFMLNSFGSMLL